MAWGLNFHVLNVDRTLNQTTYTGKNYTLCKWGFGWDHKKKKKKKRTSGKS
jgi:hypothetical protein